MRKNASICNHDKLTDVHTKTVLSMN